MLSPLRLVQEILSTVRELLDTLGRMRSDTGLSAPEENRYRDLCAAERELLALYPA